MASWKVARAALWPTGFAVTAVGASGALWRSEARSECAPTTVVHHGIRSFPHAMEQQWHKMTHQSVGVRPLPMHTDLRQHYTVESLLGQGGFGLVHLGRDKQSDSRVAIKRVCKKTTSRDKFMQEVEILRTMGGRNNIVGLCDAFETSDAYVLVTELVDGEELFDHLINQGTFAEDRAQILVREIAQSLAYLHTNCVVHGDLKPENILLSSSDLSMRLIDFGQSFHEHDSSEKLRIVGSGVATVAYAAPEVLRMETNGTGSAIDMWALGVVLYILLCGVHPFDPENAVTDEELRDRILGGNVDRTSAAWAEMSSDARDLIEQLLRVDPHERISAEQVLHHPWVIAQSTKL